MFCPAVGLNPLDPIYHVSSVFASKYILQMTLHTSVAVTDVIFASKIDVIARALTNCEFVARYNSISIGYKGKVCLATYEFIQKYHNVLERKGYFYKLNRVFQCFSRDL